jgi:hypothetical protein
MRSEFTGLLPAAINKFEELMTGILGLSPEILRGYDISGGRDDLFFWGCACQIRCNDTAALKAAAESIGITWLNEGAMAYTKSLTIDDFKTCRVTGNLELMPEEEPI